MVHSKGLVVCLKVDGKVLTESHETVNVPFDSEYTIHIKNLKPSQKALVDVFVDGQLAIKGLIVPANDYVDLERFHDGRNEKGRKFMFIEKDAAVEARRDNKDEDGLIRIEYRFEQYVKPWNPWDGETIYRSVMPLSLGGNPTKSPDFSITSASTFSCCAMEQPRDAGITERGSISTQKFVIGNIGILESEKHVMVLGMKGFHKDGKPQPWVVKTAQGIVSASGAAATPTNRFCTFCGNKPRKHDKFCGACGKKLN